MAKQPRASSPNVFARIGKYVRDVRAELRRVVWPNRQEVLNSSVIVVVTLIFFVVFTLLIDQISSFLIIDQLSTLAGR